MSERNQIVDSLLRPGQYYGDVINRQSCCGLILSELKHATGKKLAEHSHQLANFCLLIDGGYAEHYGSQFVEYRPMTVMFHPPELSHRDEIGKQGGHFFNIELEAQWMSRLGDYSFVPNQPVGSAGGDLSWLALRLFREFKTTHAYSALAIEGLVMTMLAELTRTRVKDEKQAPRWLAQVVNLLHDEFHENRTVSSMAAEVGVHPFHLSKVFKRFHQQTISDYVQGLRVRFACQELSKPEMELAEVALAAGFADQSHFTRVFKQMTGMTPGAFRAATRRSKLGKARRSVPTK